MRINITFLHGNQTSKNKFRTIKVIKKSFGQFHYRKGETHIISNKLQLVALNDVKK